MWVGFRPSLEYIYSWREHRQSPFIASSGPSGEGWPLLLTSSLFHESPQTWEMNPHRPAYPRRPYVTARNVAPQSCVAQPAVALSSGIVHPLSFHMIVLQRVSSSR
jgi:hypothetical protein